MANAAISFVIGATLAGAFNATIGQATGQFQRLGQAMASLQGQADKIAAFRQASSDLDQAKIAWTDARQKLARLKVEMDGVLEPSRALQGAFFKAQRAADIAKQAFVEKGQATRAMRAALGQAGIAVKALANEEKRLGAAIDAAKAKMETLNKLSGLRQERKQSIGDTLAAAVLPGSLIAGMKKAVGVAGDFEHGLMRFGNVAGFSQEQVEEVRQKILDLSVTTNQTAPEMLAGLEVLVGRGLNPTQALASMASIGRAATATGASVEDMAKTAFALQDSLKITPEGLAKAIDSLAQSGKSGGFELRDMAKHLPVLTAQAEALKMTGPDAVASLGAALQMAFKGTGDADKAATNLTNFLSKITAKDAVGNFEKMGIDLKKELTNAMTSGEDPILFMVERINDLAKGDAFKLNELFGDMQAQQFIRPAIEDLEKFKKIKAEALGASGVIDKDFERAKAAAKERFKGLSIAVSNFGEAIGRILLPPLGWAAEKLGAVVHFATWLAKTFPHLTAGAMGAGLAFTSYRAALLATAVAQRTLAIAGIQSTLFRGGVQSLGASLAGSFMTGIKAAIVGVRALGVAMLANPIGLAATAIAGAAWLIYEYWEPLKSFFSGLWEGIGGVFDQVSGRIKAAFAPVAGLVGSLFAPLQPILGAVAAGFSWLCDQAGRLLSNLGSLFGSSQDAAQGLEEVRSVGASVGEVIGKGLVAAFGLISAPIRGVIALIGWAAENMPGLFAVAIDWVSETAGEMSGFLSDLWKPVDTAAATVWKDITDLIGEAIDWVFEKAGEMSGFLSDLWKPVATAAAAVWNGITGLIGEAIDWVFEKAGEMSGFLSDLFEPFATAAATVWNGITGFIGEAIDWVFEKAGEMSGFLSDLFEPFATAAATVWKDITDLIGEAIDWIAGKLQWVGEAMNGLSKVGSKIGGWMGDAGSWLTFGAFDKEPSKVGDVMSIAANDNKPAIGAAMAAKPSPSRSAVGSAVAASKPAAASFAAPSASAAGQPAKSEGNVVQFRPSPSASSAQAAPTTVTVTITINAAPGMDERAIAQQVKLALQDAMREADAKRRAANHD